MAEVNDELKTLRPADLTALQLSGWDVMVWSVDHF
jgi:hypothetical protein